MSEQDIHTDIAEIKSDIKHIVSRLNESIKQQKEFCEINHKVVNDHIKDGPLFRDKVVKLETWQAIHRTVIGLIIAGTVGGFFVLLRR